MQIADRQSLIKVYKCYFSARRNRFTLLEIVGCIQTVSYYLKSLKFNSDLSDSMVHACKSFIKFSLNLYHG